MHMDMTVNSGRLDQVHVSDAHQCQVLGDCKGEQGT